MVVTGNKPFGRRGGVFGDDIVAAAMIDRLVHHDSYRLKDHDLGRVPAAKTDNRRPATTRWVSFQTDHPGSGFGRC
ncbi:ATP-binding protein [Pseudonocardia hispaniensis]|uniref:ATP-binding protein n=1 Tax=Pseudonocardia hispaniensis TaxID=904933 RepID=A0ABW1J345_9PSEU